MEQYPVAPKQLHQIFEHIQDGIIVMNQKREILLMNSAAGAFLLVPIILVVLKIPTWMTIASSLAITFISSIGSTARKLITGQVLLVPAVMIIIASVIASPFGAKAGQKMNTKILQWLLAILIAATAIKIWLDIL